MDPTKLIVPEINAPLTKDDKIIANQIVLFQMVLVLAPLHKNTISNVCVSAPIYHRTMQAVEQLENEYAGVQRRNGL
jgi:aspartate-semialdehyde dehydrogenase